MVISPPGLEPGFVDCRSTYPLYCHEAARTRLGVLLVNSLRQDLRRIGDVVLTFVNYRKMTND
jgi:hypothetical protein